MKKLLVTVTAFALCVGANAATISINEVAQRWPWNNKVDITYTVSGGQDVSRSVFARIVFTATIDGTDYIIDGVKDLGASASDGTHTVTWTPPVSLRVKSMQCAMSAQLLSAENPSGDDYMIVDLTKTSNNIAYEGLLGSQEDSNARYNTYEYKTDKMVFRKVPRWNDRAALPNASSLPSDGYPTGDNTNHKSINSEQKWQTQKDYYIGVFPVTQAQYTKIRNYNPSSRTEPIEDNPVELRPVDKVSWTTLRLSQNDNTSPLPKVTNNSGAILQRLNYITGNKYAFDLPTLVMAEIAARAGATTVYSWGDTMDIAYAWCKENTGGNTTVAVGISTANAWGLFDTAGNVFEWRLDGYGTFNLADRPDAFTPVAASTENMALSGGGAHTESQKLENFHASFYKGQKYDTQVNLNGFRVALIVD